MKPKVVEVYFESMTLNNQKVEGEVIEVGTGIFSQSERIPMAVVVGDIVIYEKSQEIMKLKLMVKNI